MATISLLHAACLHPEIQQVVSLSTFLTMLFMHTAKVPKDFLHSKWAFLETCRKMQMRDLGFGARMYSGNKI